jgi:hypothetical protein
MLSRYWITIMIVAAFAACNSLNLGGSGGNGPIPTPTSSSTTSPTPGVCGTPATSSQLVVVAMGNNIGATYTTKYGTINGYAVVEHGYFPYKAALIDHWLNGSGGTVAITSKNILQFTNVDNGGALHSAVGFEGHSFPSVPYTFPSAAASPTATGVSNTKLWSTARIEPPVSQQCYSQSFSLTPGSYYFGDLDYYNLSNFRDVLVVATPTPIR